ncbi:MAG: hypothetical protein ACI8PZ_003754 [Myxococcota bacterium]|jgi:hypothetical protein
MEREGGCLCGAVRFTAVLKGAHIGACHCGMCRKWTGGPLMSITTELVRFDSDESLRCYPSSQWAERGFCTQCGSSLFYRLKGTGRTILAFGSLDDSSGFELTHEVFVDERPSAYCFAGDQEGLTGAEVMAKYRG